jgi:hypothetical protein
VIKYHSGFRSVAIICLLALISGCEQRGGSPFFQADRLSGDPEYPRAALSILAGGENEYGDSCRIECSREDSLIFLEIVVSPLSPERINERYVKLTLDVSVGLSSIGLVVSDTAGLELPGPGSYPLALRIENAAALESGANSVGITALTRYLDASGDLAAPLGRELRYCNLEW